MSLDEGTLVSKAHSLSINETDGRSAGPSTIPADNQDDGLSRLKQQLSEETMRLLNVLPDNKRKLDPSNDPRADYPPATRAVYLKLKDLYKRKLTLVLTLVNINNCIDSKRIPRECDVRISTPPRIAGIQKYADDWGLILTKAKKDLSDLYHRSLIDSYKTTMAQINTHLSSLEELASKVQFEEMKQSLMESYAKAAKNNNKPPTSGTAKKRPVRPRSTNRRERSQPRPKKRAKRSK